MHIALFGGSFNPPHVGHMMAAYYVVATRPVDKLWLMPAYRHPFGKRLAPFDDRVKMCELAAQPFGKWMEVSRVEEQVGGEGRTVEVLEFLVRRYTSDRFSLVLGTDILPEKSKWKDFHRIEELAGVIIVPRAGYPDASVPGPAIPEVASTEIRGRLVRGQDVSHLVPRAVAEYAARNGLYRTSES
jgi:nicotinate-nucleotide adenylyltransferase